MLDSDVFRSPGKVYRNTFTDQTTKPKAEPVSGYGRGGWQWLEIGTIDIGFCKDTPNDACDILVTSS